MHKIISRRITIVFFAVVLVLAGGMIGLRSAGIFPARRTAANSTRNSQADAKLAQAVKLAQALNKEGGIDSLTKEEKEADDVNHDGVIDMKDVNQLLKANAGLK